MAHGACPVPCVSPPQGHRGTTCCCGAAGTQSASSFQAGDCQRGHVPEEDGARDQAAAAEGNAVSRFCAAQCRGCCGSAVHGGGWAVWQGDGTHVPSELALPATAPPGVVLQLPGPMGARGRTVPGLPGRSTPPRAPGCFLNGLECSLPGALSFSSSFPALV